MKHNYFLLTAFLLFALPASIFAQAQIPLVYDVENTGADSPLPVMLPIDQCPEIDRLPNPFEFSDGSRFVTSFADWKDRRAEIKAEIEHYEIGFKPPRPSGAGAITATFDAGTRTLTVTIKHNDQTITLRSTVTMPTGTGTFPVIIGMNSATGSLPADLVNGFIQIPFNHDQVSKYGSDRPLTNEPFCKMYPEYVANGQYSAWSWGISRLIDGLEIVKDQMKADMAHIGIAGCSYAGKMALFGGAFDERIALTIPLESGGGGTASWRVSETLGEVETLAATDDAWFMVSALDIGRSRKTKKLPYDHHELLAMVAPRACIAIGNDGWVWMADESGYVSCRAAHEVYKSFGIGDRFGFDLTGHSAHCSSFSTSQITVLRNFIDKFLRGDNSINTENVTTNPYDARGVDYEIWKSDWVIGISGFRLTASASPAAGGNVAVNPPLAPGTLYEEGAVVTVTAEAANDWKFAGWGGDAENETEASFEMTMDGNKTVTAKFLPTKDGENLIKNGDFANQTENWTLNEGQYYGDSDGALSVTGGKTTVSLTAVGTDRHQPQFVQIGIPLDQGMKYRLTFKASAAAERDIQVLIQQHGTWATYVSKDFNLTATEETYTLEFEMTEPSDPNVQLAFNFGGGSMQSVTISDVSLIYTSNDEGTVEIPIILADANTNLRVNVLPNSAINVNFTATNSGETEIRLYSLNGSLLAQDKLNTLEGKNYSHTFEQGFSGGFYVVWMNSNGKVERAKVIVPN